MRSKISILLFSLVWTSMSLAQTKANVVAAPSDAASSGVGINNIVAVGYLNTASNMETNYKGSGGETKLEGQPALGLGLRYMNVRKGKVGVSAGALYEGNRTVKTLYSNGEATPVPQEIKYNSNILELSLTHGNSPNSYIFGGMNYPVIVSTSGFEGVDVVGQIGGQVGLGFILPSKFIFEGAFRTQNYIVSTKTQSTDQARLWGVVFNIGYTL